jgi:hypothetical protein
MTHADFLARAWKLANDKARELGWISHSTKVLELSPLV